MMLDYNQVMSSPLPPPEWIDYPEDLQRIAKTLAREPRLAVDTESNSLHAYHEQVCLIQFSTPKKDILIDPLELHDLSPLAPIFANPQIEKIFHAVEYDVICLRRDFHFEFVNIFDTMQSARILGYAQVGLDALLMEKFGLEVDKRYQKADWAYRPLTPEMLNYARQDTHHLIRLRDLMQAELEAAGRWDLAREEFVRLSKLDVNGKPEVPTWQRISRGEKKMTGDQLAILKELCTWRDQTAQHLGRPAFKVLDNKRLIAVAIAMPELPSELKPILTEHQGHRFGRDVLHAVRRGKTAPPLTRPRPPIKPKKEILDRGHALGELRKRIGKEMKVDSDIILPKAWMQAIAEDNPRSIPELAPLMPDSPWRVEKFGEEILKAIH